MPIYVESRDLNAAGGFIAEHQYLVYIPDGEELNYDAWKYIGAFPSDPDNPDGSILTRANIIDDLFSNAEADRWTMDDFLQNLDQIGKVAAVAATLEIPFDDVTVSDMVDEGYGGSTGGAAIARHRELVYDGGALSGGASG